MPSVTLIFSSLLPCWACPCCCWCGWLHALGRSAGFCLLPGLICRVPARGVRQRPSAWAKQRAQEIAWFYPLFGCGANPAGPLKSGLLLSQCHQSPDGVKLNRRRRPWFARCKGAPRPGQHRAPIETLPAMVAPNLRRRAGLSTEIEMGHADRLASTAAGLRSFRQRVWPSGQLRSKQGAQSSGGW